MVWREALILPGSWVFLLTLLGKALLWDKPWSWRVINQPIWALIQSLLKCQTITWGSRILMIRACSKPARTAMGVGKRGESRVWQGYAQKEGTAFTTCESLESSKRNSTKRVTSYNHEHPPQVGTRGTQCIICSTASLTRVPVTPKLCRSLCASSQQKTLSNHHPSR